MSEDEKNPIVTAQEKARTELPRRFYEKAEATPDEGGFVLSLDGRIARTPARRRIVVPDRRVAEALAAEWNAQGEHIDPSTMPLTRILNSAIDGVAQRMDEVRADIVRHAGSDLVFYRAEGPEGLVARQDEAWRPILDWARTALGARFILSEGVMFVAQPPDSLSAVARSLIRHDMLSLAALHVMTTLMGSSLLALAVAEGRLTPEEAWEAAHVDEDWQMSQWGRDEVALARRDSRWREMQAAGILLRSA